ncbi:MAG: hypothetical protein AUH88_04130 [Acidobacteria bacterium 13_1_40CM_4_61_5]|nr:MAG: hypothetical protein AUH88_04130 [Acidobacteria bacterium 13_1_40CM_4_61_5]OLE85395.1 MAG: hypothetical protein AUG07_04680 [Acidobacteria bacterium 13_1_20CM_2_60_10]PYU04405.1 MAG: hypothetical protein DMG33_14350 [Acidobacteriota bacterium]
MKKIRSSILCFVVLLLAAPVLRAQDLSKYRNFSLGMSLVELSNQVDLKPLQTKLIHKRPAVIQELTWWPRRSFGSSLQVDSVWQAFFTFYNGELYRILVTYDPEATKGLTAEDMVQAISAQYGTATRPDAQISFPTNELYRSTEKVIARWEDSQFSINLYRSRSLNFFALIMFSKRLDGQAEAAIADAVELERQEALQTEVARVKKESDNLQVVRQKNRKTFRP